MRRYLVLVNACLVASLCLLPTRTYAAQLAGLVVNALAQYAWLTLVLQYSLSNHELG